jgi:CBS domain containing-hemolysin-like protein
MREQGIPVREVMRPLRMYTVDHSKSIASAARLFVKHGVSFLPVCDGKKIIGVLSARELFYRHYQNTRFIDHLIYGNIKKSAGGQIINGPATV